MKVAYNIGDLVHIPQSVVLIDHPPGSAEDPQLCIPLRIEETTAPTVGIITKIAPPGYVRVYCEGNTWSVKDDTIYTLKKREERD